MYANIRVLFAWITASISQSLLKHTKRRHPTHTQLHKQAAGKGGKAKAAAAAAVKGGEAVEGNAWGNAKPCPCGVEDEEEEVYIQCEQCLVWCVSAAFLTRCVCCVWLRLHA